MLKKITLILFFLITQIIYAQSSTATYSSGNIRTGDGSWPGSCNAKTLTLTVPIGATITGVDVSYNFQARNSGWMSEQRSQIYCQETGNDEGGFISGTGNSTGTQTYNRTGLSLANGISASGSLTFEMRAFRTWSEAGYAGCKGRNNRILNNTWTITVNYTIPPSIGGYLGPGGVGKVDGTSNLEVWLRADDLNADNDFTNNPSNGTKVDSWNDYSGNAKNYTITGVNRPTYNSAGTFEAVNFNASLPDAQYLVTASGGNYTEGSVIFATNPVNSGNSVGAFENATFSLRIEQWNNTNRIGYTRYGTADYQSSLVTPFNINSIISWHKEASSSNMTTYSNNNSNTFSIGDSYNGIPYDRIGRNSVSADEASGDVFETILYSQKLNDAELIIVNNYLSAKYGGINILNDFYTNDNTINGNFDYNVAGIGQANDGSKHEDSQGTGIIRINTPSSLGLDRYLFWGEESKTPTYNFTTVTSDYTDRLNSKWRVNKRNDLGTVSVSVLASNLDLSGFNCGNLRLIVSSDASFSTKSSYTMSLSSGVYTATAVNFSDGDYFTLEYTDVIAVDGTQFYNGSGASNVPNTTDDCFKLLVKSTATGSLPLTENADVREVEVETGGKLVVNNGFRLQVTNGINNSGEIRMLGNSQLLQTHTGTSQVSGSGLLFIDQTGTLTNVYQSGYWSSPVTSDGNSFTISEILKDGTSPTSVSSNPPNINFTSTAIYDGAKTNPITISGKWLATLINDVDWTREISATGVSLTPTQGWNMKSTGEGVQNFTFKGIINDGNYTSLISQNRLNLIGNPYPSALDADQFLTDNISNIVSSLYFYESGNDTSHYRNTYTGGYATRVIGLGTPYGAGKTPGKYIGVGQAFFVWRSGAGNANIQFNNNQRAFQTIGGVNQFFSKSEKNYTSSFRTSAQEETLFPVIRLSLSFNISEEKKHQRQVAIGFRGLTSNYENGYDAEMFDRKPTDLSLTQEGTSSPMVITGIEKFNNSLEIPLNVYLDTTRKLTFTLEEAYRFKSNQNIYIFDKVENKHYNIAEAPIDLTLSSGVYSDRFFITFKNKSSLRVNELNTGKYLSAFLNTETKEISVTKTDFVNIKSISLFDLKGKKVQNWKTIPKKNTFNLKVVKANSGIYLLKIDTNKNSITKKIVIVN